MNSLLVSQTLECRPDTGGLPIVNECLQAEPVPSTVRRLALAGAGVLGVELELGDAPPTDRRESRLRALRLDDRAHRPRSAR